MFWHFDFDIHFAPQSRSLFEQHTSKSALNMHCFGHFDFEMCFALQPHAAQRLNCQKCSEPEVFLTFWLPHVLCVTAVHFLSNSTSKSAPGCSVRNVLSNTAACNFGNLILPHSCASVALTSLLFDPPELQNVGKDSVSRLFYLFMYLGVVSTEAL